MSTASASPDREQRPAPSAGRPLNKDAPEFTLPSFDEYPSHAPSSLEGFSQLDLPGAYHTSRRQLAAPSQGGARGSNENSFGNISTMTMEEQDSVNHSWNSGGDKSNTLYKTELCHTFSINGFCKYKDKCQFAHGLDELRPLTRHPKYKTTFCRSFMSSGHCPYGNRCHFVHNAEEANLASSWSASARRSDLPASLYQPAPAHRSQHHHHHHHHQQQHHHHRQAIPVNAPPFHPFSTSLPSSPLPSAPFAATGGSTRGHHSGRLGSGFALQDSLDSPVFPNDSSSSLPTTGTLTPSWSDAAPVSTVHALATNGPAMSGASPADLEQANYKLFHHHSRLPGVASPSSPLTNTARGNAFHTVAQHVHPRHQNYAQPLMPAAYAIHHSHVDTKSLLAFQQHPAVGPSRGLQSTVDYTLYSPESLDEGDPGLLSGHLLGLAGSFNPANPANPFSSVAAAPTPASDSFFAAPLPHLTAKAFQRSISAPLHDDAALSSEAFSWGESVQSTGPSSAFPNRPDHP